MMDSWERMFYLIGVICCIMIGLLIFAAIMIALDDFAKRKWYDHQIKHRFDKPPLSKCYCKDCKKWDSRSYGPTCNLYGYARHTPPNGFCYMAEPKEFVSKLPKW